MANLFPHHHARGDFSLHMIVLTCISLSYSIPLSYRPIQHYLALSHLELLVRLRHQQSFRSYSPDDPGADTVDPRVLVVWPPEPSFGAISSSRRVRTLQ